jgi:cellulose synthase (UDP-forming)
VLSTILGRRLEFIVTPKRRQSGRFLTLVWPQIAVIALTTIAICSGVYSLASGARGSLTSVSMNVFWGAYNIFMLAPIVRAAVLRPPEGWKPKLPPLLLAGS